MTIKKSVFSKFRDVFTLAPPSLFKSRPVFTALLNGQTVKSNVNASFSIIYFGVVWFGLVFWWFFLVSKTKLL
jgi:hypothetical protein